MPVPRQAADAVMKEFAIALAQRVGAEGWSVSRFIGDGSDRSFVLEKGVQRIPFLAKLSQSEQGFWGITYPRGEEMLSGSDHLVLLTGPTRGYVMRHSRLPYYFKRFSRAKAGYRINEREIKQAPYCFSIDGLWEEIKRAAGA